MAGSKKKAKAAPGPAHQLKVTLLGSEPEIWRRILVPSETTLAELHEILQTVMGWENDHMHQFHVKKERYADPEFGSEGAGDSRRVTVADVAPRKGSRFHYEYDFGDGWEHEIRVEAVLPAGDVAVRPVCLDGARAGPPEDSGGIGRYQYVLEVLIDPQHEEYGDVIEWYGEHFDPEHWDKDRVNRRL